MNEPSRRWVLGLSAVLGLSLLPTASYAAALPLIREEWGLSGAEAGAVFAAYQAGYVAATLVLLPLTDRLSPRRMIILMTGVSAIANALFPLLAQELVSALFFRFLAGAALVGIYMPGTRVVAQSFASERRGGPVGLYVAAFYLGTSLSVLITGLLLPALGWRGAYLAAGGLGCIALPVAWMVLQRAPAFVERSEGARTRPTGRLEPAALRNRPALLAIAAYSGHTWELYAARGWIAPFLASAIVTLGLPLEQAASLGAILSGAAFGIGSLSVLGAGFVSDRLGRTLTAGLFLAGSGACSLTIGWLSGMPLWALLLLTLCYGLLVGGDSPVYSTAVTELSRPERLGSTMAFQAFAGFLTSIVSPVAVGGVLDLAPAEVAWGYAFSVAGAGALAGLIALAGLRKHPASRNLAGGRR